MRRCHLYQFLLTVYAADGICNLESCTFDYSTIKSSMLALTTKFMSLTLASKVKSLALDTVSSTPSGITGDHSVIQVKI
jgi:hypothetical protein